MGQVRSMQAKIVKANTLSEYLTPERCFIFENWGLFSAGDKVVSIARARVEPKVTTKAHHLEGVQEIYLITKGKGRVQIGGLKPADVVEGDTVVIPAGTSQKVTNTGKTDLVFYCVCTPAFTQACYVAEEAERTV
jgi:mannose-6-phosphate isomerase-like protein (cupin superfamily)